MQIKTKHQAGFTLVEIMIVVAIIAILSSVVLPNLLKSRARAQKNACIKNLQAIDGAKELWGIENRKSQGTAIDNSGVISYLKYGRIPLCPGGGIYSFQSLDVNPICTLASVGHTI